MAGIRTHRRFKSLAPHPIFLVSGLQRVLPPVGKGAPFDTGNRTVSEEPRGTNG